MHADPAQAKQIINGWHVSRMHAWSVLVLCYKALWNMEDHVHFSENTKQRYPLFLRLLGLWALAAGGVHIRAEGGVSSMIAVGDCKEQCSLAYFHPRLVWACRLKPSLPSDAANLALGSR